MQQLRLVRTTEEALVVSPLDHSVDDGPTPQYSIMVDERFRAAVARVPGRRAETTRPRVRTSMSPRELQGRIRAGQALTDVAEAAGMPVEKVERYASPVLAERAYVAETVRKLAAPHPGSDSRRPLGEIVDERLAAEADGGSVRWDAWLEQDGTWTVQVTWERDQRPLAARWAWHPARRALRPRDGIAEDVARPLHDGDPMAFVRPLRPVQPRGGDLPDVEQVPVRPAPAGSESSAALPEPPAAPAAASRDTIPGPDAPISEPVVATSTVASAPPEPAELPEEERRAVGDGRPQPRPRPGAAPRASGRASVPSWDDIVFGARQHP